MAKPNVHPLLALAGDFLNLLSDQPRVDAADLRALASKLGRWGGTLFEIEAWRRDPAGLDEETLNDLVVRVDALFTAARADWSLLQVACLAAAGVLRTAAKAGFEVEPLAKHFEQDRLGIIARDSDAHAFGARLSRFLLLEGIYDAAVCAADHKAWPDRRDRRREADSMLQLIARMDSARDERKAVLGNKTAEAANECARINIAQEHRRLSWETSYAVEKNGEKTDHPARWIALAEHYRNNGDETNAVGALSNGLERFVEIWERTRRADLLESIHELAAALREGAAHLPSEVALEIGKVQARAELAQGRPNAAADVVERAVNTTKDLLASAGDDEFRKSYLLRDADDWIGLAAAAKVEAALRVRTVLRPTAPAELKLEPEGETRFLYPVLGRQRAGILYHQAGQLRILECAVAHDVARTIDDLHRHAERDVNDYQKGTAKEDRWRELLGRLAGMLRLHDLRDQIDGQHVVMLLEGSSLHVPWPALFIATARACRSVELRLLQRQVSTTVGEVTGSLVLNAFKMKPSPEQWHQAISALSTELAGKGVALNEAKDEKAGLVLLGAHGQRRAFGDLSLVVGDLGAMVAAADFVAQAPIGRTTFCGVCYAGGGFLSGTGEWESLPSLLLRRGAERVLANAWPAWDLPPKRADLARLLECIRTAPGSRDAAEAVTAWQQGSAQEHPRWWSGWGLWTTLPA